MYSVASLSSSVFLSTLSLRRATLWVLMGDLSYDNFYPRSPCGERPDADIAVHDGILFLSTLSLRRATLAVSGEVVCEVISIHALLAESDNSAYGALDGASISIHALLAESDKKFGFCDLEPIRFLSTLSLRRATILKVYGYGDNKFLSTLSLRRATLF